jgi:hypothetical protein
MDVNGNYEIYEQAMIFSLPFKSRKKILPDKGDTLLSSD